MRKTKRRARLELSIRALGSMPPKLLHVHAEGDEPISMLRNDGVRLSCFNAEAIVLCIHAYKFRAGNSDDLLPFELAA